MANWVENRIEMNGDNSKIKEFIEIGKGYDSNGNDSFIFSNFFKLLGIKDNEIEFDDRYKSLVGCKSIGFYMRVENENTLCVSTKLDIPQNFFLIFSSIFEFSFRITSIEYNTGWSSQLIGYKGNMKSIESGNFEMFGNKYLYGKNETINHIYFKDEVEEKKVS